MTNPNELALSFRDYRDDCSYKVILLGQRLWTAENHRYNGIFGTFGLDNIHRNIHELGGFYARSVVDTVCPPGWKVPTVQEWEGFYSAWKKRYNNLNFLEFASGSDIDELGVLPMNGIGKLGDNLLDEASFSQTHKAAYFWTSTLDDSGDRKIFGIADDGVKIFTSVGDELCNLRFVKSIKREKEGDIMS